LIGDGVIVSDGVVSPHYVLGDNTNAMLTE